jgi:hypothetical protein
MYLLVFSRLSYQLSLSKPSLLAAAAVYLARATVGIRESDPSHAVHPEGFWTRTLEHYTGYKLEDLRDSVLIIHRYQLGAEKAENTKGVFNKFSKSSHHFASLKTAVRVCLHRNRDLGLYRSSQSCRSDGSSSELRTSASKRALPTITWTSKPWRKSQFNPRSFGRRVAALSMAPMPILQNLQ